MLRSVREGDRAATPLLSSAPSRVTDREFTSVPPYLIEPELDQTAACITVARDPSDAVFCRHSSTFSESISTARIFASGYSWPKCAATYPTFAPRSTMRVGALRRCRGKWYCPKKVSQRVSTSAVRFLHTTVLPSRARTASATFSGRSLGEYSNFRYVFALWISENTDKYSSAFLNLQNCRRINVSP